MTDEEYVERAAAALDLEEQLLADGKSHEEIDAFFLECRQYEFDLVSQQLIEDGHSPEQVEAFWAELTRFYDSIETYDEHDDVGTIDLVQLLIIVLVVVLIFYFVRRV